MTDDSMEQIGVVPSAAAIAVQLGIRAVLYTLYAESPKELPGQSWELPRQIVQEEIMSRAHTGPTRGQGIDGAPV